MALAQGVFVIWVRVFSSEYELEDDAVYEVVATASESDVETCIVPDPPHTPHPPHPPHTPRPREAETALTAFGPRTPMDISGASDGLTPTELEELTARNIE